MEDSQNFLHTNLSKIIFCFFLFYFLFVFSFFLFRSDPTFILAAKKVSYSFIWFFDGKIFRWFLCYSEMTQWNLLWLEYNNYLIVLLPIFLSVLNILLVGKRVHRASWAACVSWSAESRTAAVTRWSRKTSYRTILKVYQEPCAMMGKIHWILRKNNSTLVDQSG